MKPGFNRTVFDVLKEKFSTETENDRMVVLSVDEISIKSSLDYDRNRDLVDGFEDYDNIRLPRVADHALVFMIQGLSKRWKQPLCYFLTNGGASGQMMGKLVEECIVKLREATLMVKAVVCDQGANNRVMFSKLNITLDKPFLDINGNRVFFLYDPPHLLKSIRNNLKKYDIKFRGGVAKWQHIKMFFDKDSSQSCRLAPKLKLRPMLLQVGTGLIYSPYIYIYIYIGACSGVTQCPGMSHIFQYCRSA